MPSVPELRASIEWDNITHTPIFGGNISTKKEKPKNEQECCYMCGYWRDKVDMVEITNGNKLYKVIQQGIKNYTQDPAICNAPILKICDSCISNNYKLIFPYQYNPETFIFYRLPEEKNWSNKLYFGVELEIEDRQNVKWHTVIGDLPEFVYCKSDSSLSNGFEVVSHPATFNWLKQHKLEWDKILNLRSKGFSSQETNTCDIHIHLSKVAFTPLHLYKFMKFIYKNKLFSSTIGQKTVNNCNGERCRKLLKYNQTGICKTARYKTNYHSDRYTAVNLQRNKTVEIRIFKGSLLPDIFWKNIEFCKALYDFTLNSDLETAKSVTKFRKFVRNNPKEFSHLIWFMNLPQEIILSEKGHNTEMSLL